MILLIYSKLDIAGVNIAKFVLQKYPFEQNGQTFQESHVCRTIINRKDVFCVALKQESVQFQSLSENFPNAELAVFLSRHSSQSGTPTLSVHTPGNFGKADFGGLPRRVSVAPAKAMQTALITMSEQKTENHLDYEVSYECTHHGPSLTIPTMFVELGSSEPQWRDLKAAEVVASAALAAVEDFGDMSQVSTIGVGGTHYNQKFTKMALNDEAIFGHMIPKHAISSMDLEMFLQCINRTYEKVGSITLDWKGIKGEDKAKLLASLQKTGLQLRKV